MRRPAILMYKGSGILSWLIRAQTRSKFSHTALHLRTGKIIDSQYPDGVKCRPFEQRDDVRVFTVNGVTAEQWNKVFEFARAKIGRPYDWLAVFRFVSRRQCQYNGKWFCSELVFAAFKMAGINLLERTEPWEVSPGMLSRSPLLTEISLEDLLIE